MAHCIGWMLIALTIMFQSAEATETIEEPSQREKYATFWNGIAPSSIPCQGVSGISSDAIDSFIKEILVEHQVPGAAMAITYKGRLVYARGFGFANVETQQPVKPESLFRIASIAKPLTATAVLKLCDAGLLKLDDRVITILDDYQPSLKNNEKIDPRLEKITIRQLLQHRAGWDRAKSGDPMFESVQIAQALGTPPPASQEDTIRYVLGKPLDFNPGERYAYSNFGYCLLGRVIEEISGKSYEEYVQTEILAPLGISEMRIGRTLEKCRYKGEVKYYDPDSGTSIFEFNLGEQVPEPYGAWHLEAMDAHGGWIASAIDLVKFASRYDKAAKPPLLSSDSQRALRARPPGLAGFEENGSPKKVIYGLGWQIHTNHDGEPIREMHIGSLPGTSTLLVRQTDGVCFAILFNARHTPFTSDICSQIWRELSAKVNEVSQWPNVDYFSED